MITISGEHNDIVRANPDNWVICPKCNGDGKGESCFEQGGTIYGLCPRCCGHGKWMKNMDQWTVPADAPPELIAAIAEYKASKWVIERVGRWWPTI